MEIKTQRDLAKALGLSIRRLNQLMAEGRIDRVPKGQPIDLEKIKQQYRANTDQLRAAGWRVAKGQDHDPTAEPVAKRLAEDRAKEQHFKALLAEHEFQKRAGTVIDRTEVEKTCFEIARIVRGRVQGLEPRLQPFLTDLGREKLKSELHAALAEFADLLSERLTISDG